MFHFSVAVATPAQVERLFEHANDALEGTAHAIELDIASAAKVVFVAHD
jgi:hypothetical protein